MKREILFRGKRSDNGEWVKGYLIGNNVIVGEVVDFDEDYFTTEFWYKVDPETVGQFTGLTDKNGAKVFEGDVVSFSSWKHGSHSYNPDFVFVYEIRFTRLSWYCCGDGFSVKLHQEMQDTPLNNDGCIARIIEVIGNIYDNHELIKP